MSRAKRFKIQRVNDSGLSVCGKSRGYECSCMLSQWFTRHLFNRFEKLICHCGPNVRVNFAEHLCRYVAGHAQPERIGPLAFAADSQDRSCPPWLDIFLAHTSRAN